MGRRRGAELGTASALLVFGAFQLALAGGAPWGRAAYGGLHLGVLPGHLHVVSGIAAVAYLTGSSLVIGQVGSLRAGPGGFTGVSVLMGIGTAANAASRSPVERALWTPLAVATAALAWASRVS